MFKNLSMAALGSVGSQREAIELSLSYGFTGIDLNASEFLASVESQGIERVQRLLKSAKLKLGCFEYHFDFDGDDQTFSQQLAIFAVQAKTMAEVGCYSCLTYVQPGSNTATYHENFERHRERLEQIERVLDTIDIRLAIGFIGDPQGREEYQFEFIQSFDALVTLVSMVPSQKIGVAIDTWQILLTGGNWEDAKKLGAERIAAVFLSDAVADKPVGELTNQDKMLPGRGGAMDSVAILTSLAEMEYAGPVTPAAFPGTMEAGSRDARIREAGKTLSGLWTQANLDSSGKLVASTS